MSGMGGRWGRSVGAAEPRVGMLVRTWPAATMSLATRSPQLAIPDRPSHFGPCVSGPCSRRLASSPPSRRRERPAAFLPNRPGSPCTRHGCRHGMQMQTSPETGLWWVEVHQIGCYVRQVHRRRTLSDRPKRPGERGDGVQAKRANAAYVRSWASVIRRVRYRSLPQGLRALATGSWLPCAARSS